MKALGYFIFVTILLVAMSSHGYAGVPTVGKTRTKRNPAQDPPRFSPPRPDDFDDPADDELENGDAPNRAQVPPPAVVTPLPVTNNNDFHSPSGTQSKLKFDIADGEFYEKGKKRGRSPMAKRTTQSVQSK